MPEHLSEHTVHALKLEIPPAFFLFQNCFGYSGTFIFLFEYSGINLSIFAPKKGKKQACLLWDSVWDGLNKLGEADSSD